MESRTAVPTRRTTRARYRIHAAFAILATGAVWISLARLDQPARSASRSLAATSASPTPPGTLPAIALPKSDAALLTRIELSRPADSEQADGAPEMQTVTLERHGAAWEMTSPLRTRASLAKVEALIDNLENLHLWTMLDGGTGLYDRYDLGDSKALHIVAWKGPDRARDRAIDLYYGKSGAQGQLVRLAGRDGTFALVNWGPQGYAGFLYARDVRSWREVSISRFDENDAERIEIINPSGSFSFARRGGAGAGSEWSGTFARRGRDGALRAPEPEWRRFDPGRVRDLLAAYKALDADDFGQPGERAGSGVDQAERTGGVIRIKLRSSAPDVVVRVGKLTMSRSRWAIDKSRFAVRDGDDGTLYALSPWTAAWATGPASQFEQPRVEGTSATE